MSLSATGLSSIVIILEFCSLTFSSSALTSSSVTSTTVFSTSIPLYSPSVTSGFTATVAVKIKGFPFSICSTSISGLETISSLLSSAAFSYASGIISFAASS